MAEPMSADEARGEVETWLAFHAENRPGDGDRMGVSYERAPLHRSALRALLDQNARLLAESVQSTAAPAYIWTYNDDDGDPGMKRCHQCGRPGTRGFTTVPAVTVDHIPGVEPGATIGPFVECASRTACRRRWPKTTPEEF